MFGFNPIQTCFESLIFNNRIEKVQYEFSLRVKTSIQTIQQIILVPVMSCHFFSSSGFPHQQIVTFCFYLRTNYFCLSTQLNPLKTIFNYVCIKIAISCGQTFQIMHG